MFPRRAVAAILLLTGVAVSGVALAATLSVNSITDAGDAAPGDGTCALPGSGVCSLRAAIQQLRVWRCYRQHGKP